MSTARPVRVVITSDRFYGTDLAMEREVAASYPGLAVDVVTELAPDDETMIRVATGADAIVTSSVDAVPRRVIEALPGLRVIGRYAVGYDNIDLVAAAEHGVVVTHYPGYCTDEVADHALSLILALNRRLFPSDRRVREGHWAGHNLETAFVAGGEIHPLREITVGVVGFGRIGRAVLARLRPFGCRVVVADPGVEPGQITAAGAEAMALPDLLAASDILTLHCPLTSETRHLIGPAELAAMRAGSMLVNTARGPIVDGEALSAALRSDHLAGAALDVMEREPLDAGDPLMTVPNLILTPHSAYYSARSMETLRRETWVDVLTALAGGSPRTVVRPPAG